MAYNKINWVNDDTELSAENFNYMEDGIANSYNVSLLAVSETAPSECSTGDKYYNTTTKKIYTATATNTWGASGEDPISDILYIVLEERTSYTYDGTDLVSVGGGSGSEIIVGTDTPTEDTKLVIDEYDLDAQYVEEKNIITATFTTNHTIASASAEKVALNQSVSGGNKLTLNTTNNGIVIGSGITKVKVSANINFQTVTSGIKVVSIYLNNATAYTNTSEISSRTTLIISPVLLEVQEGDIIYLYVQGNSEDVLRRNMAFSNITVEVVE